MEFFDVFQSITFCFSTWTCLSNCVQKVSWKDFWDNIPLPSLTVHERCWQGPAWSPAIGQELERLMGKRQYIHHVMRAMCQAVSAGLWVCVWVSVWPGEEEFMSTHQQYCSLLSFPIEHIAAHSSAELSWQTHDKCLRVCVQVCRVCVCLCKGERKETISYLTTFTLNVVTLNKKQNCPLKKGLAEWRNQQYVQESRDNNNTQYMEHC